MLKAGLDFYQEIMFWNKCVYKWIMKNRNDSIWWLLSHSKICPKKERKFWGAINPLRTLITMTGRLKWTTQLHQLGWPLIVDSWSWPACLHHFKVVQARRATKTLHLFNWHSFVPTIVGWADFEGNELWRVQLGMILD